MSPSMEPKQEQPPNAAVSGDSQNGLAPPTSGLGDADSHSVGNGGLGDPPQSYGSAASPSSMQSSMTVPGGMGGPAMGMGMGHVIGNQGMHGEVAGGKKAVHVKWAGKTIALGTFPQAEADEKCARAKALTRSWRSTMRPKPEREWVMKELERLGVRVVSGRLGRKEGGGDGSSDDDDRKKGDSKGKKKKDKKPDGIDPMDRNGMSDDARRVSLSSGLPGGGMPPRSGSLDLRRDSLTYRGGAMTPTLLSATENMARNRSLDWGGERVAPRRNSSLAMALLHGGGDTDSIQPPLPGSNSRNTSLSLPVKSDGRDSPTGMPKHRPLVGGGSAAAYEAARADYYANIADKEEPRQSRRGSNAHTKRHSLDLSSALSAMDSSSSGRNLLGGGGMSHMGLSVNPDQHYEMLKLHHMNLLNEIQETTLMMNLYQQQRLQQQQMQQSQSSSDPPSMEQQLQQLAQQQATASSSLEQMYGGGGGSGGDRGSSQYSSSLHSHGSSMHSQSRLGGHSDSYSPGLGSGGGGSSNQAMQSLLLQERQRMQGGGLNGMLPDTEQRRHSLRGGGGDLRRQIEEQEQRRQIEEQEALLRQMKEDFTRKRPVDSDSDWRNGEKKKRKGSEDS